jgi:hypothetical protein
MEITFIFFGHYVTAIQQVMRPFKTRIGPASQTYIFLYGEWTTSQVKLFYLLFCIGVKLDLLQEEYLDISQSK